MVIDTDTLRPDMSVKMSFGEGAFEEDDAGVMPVMAWLSARLFTANRTREPASLVRPLSV